MNIRINTIDRRTRIYTLYSMRTRVAKWGNSLGLRLPKALADSLSLADGVEVELLEQGDAILLRPVGRHYRMKDLLKGIHSGNLHGEQAAGDRRGGEEW